MATVKVDGVTYPDAKVRFETLRIPKPDTETEYMDGTVSCCVHIPSAHLEGRVTVEYEGHGTAQGEARVMPVPNSRQLQTVVAMAEPFQAAPR